MNSAHTNPIQEILHLSHTISTRIKLAVPNGELPSQLEKDLLKDDVKRLYILIEQLSVYSDNGDAAELLVKSGRKNPETDLSVIVSQLITQQAKSAQEMPTSADSVQPEEHTAIVTNATIENHTDAHPEVAVPTETPSSSEPLSTGSVKKAEEKTIAPRLHEIRTVEMYEAQKTIAGNYTAGETLGDKINRSQATTSIGDKLQHQPLKDLKLSIGINERFAFIKDLFGGDQQHFLAAIEHLNNLADFEAAEKYINDFLAPRFQWELHNERSEELLELVKRRFSV